MVSAQLGGGRSWGCLGWVCWHVPGFSPSPAPDLCFSGVTLSAEVGANPPVRGWIHHCSPTGTTAIVGKTGLGGVAVVVAPNLPVNFFKLCRSS